MAHQGDGGYSQLRKGGDVGPPVTSAVTERAPSPAPQMSRTTTAVVLMQPQPAAPIVAAEVPALVSVDMSSFVAMAMSAHVLAGSVISPFVKRARKAPASVARGFASPRVWSPWTLFLRTWKWTMCASAHVLTLIFGRTI